MFWPQHQAEPSWRFGATGLFSRALMTPLLGLALAVVLAFFLEHRFMLRLLGALAGLSALILAGVLVFFGLDAIQMRTQVRPEANLVFDVASVTAAVKIIFATLATLAFAWGAWMAPKTLDEAPRPKTKASRPGQAGTAASPLVGGSG